jgi:hypothetical protein
MTDFTRRDASFKVAIVLSFDVPAQSTHTDHPLPLPCCHDLA